MMKERAALYMRTLADCGSITQAAAQLYVTPSALSKYIAGLEKETGNVLFSRVGNHFVLTHEGRTALDWLTRIEALSEQMDIAMGDLTSQRSGLTRFGVQTTLSDFMLREVLPGFMAEYPGVRVAMSEEHSVAILEKMRRFELDFAISTHRPEVPQYVCEPLARMEQVLLVPSDHPLVARAVRRPDRANPWVDLEWCAGERLVLMHPGQSPRRDMNRNLQPILAHMNVVLEVRTMRSMLNAVENGLGIAPAADGIARLYSRKWTNLTQLSYGEDLPLTIFYLYYNRDVHLSLATRTLIDRTRRALADINGFPSKQ